MIISINSETVNIPSDIITVADLASSRNIPVKGTAIAINGKIVKADKWEVTRLNDNDTLMIISAAYGG